jgi:ligand-binding sensor domain-containing protein
MKTSFFFFIVSLIILLSISAQCDESWSYLVNSNYVNAQVLDGKDLFFATKGSVVKYDTTSGDVKRFTKADGLYNYDVQNIVLDGKGNIWVTTKYGIWRYDKEKWDNFDSQNGITPKSDFNEFKLAIDKNGDLWAGSNAGIYFFNGYTFEQKFSDQISHIAFDNDGNLWRIGLADGVYKYENSEWIHYSTENGLPTNNLYSIFFDSSGNVWLYGIVDSTSENTITKFDGETMTVFGAEEGFFYQVSDMAEDSMGNLWFAAYDLVLKFDGNKWSEFECSFLYPDYYKDYLVCNSISVDSNDAKWVGSESGIVTFNIGQLTATHFELSNDFSIDNFIKTLEFAPNGVLWVGGLWSGITSYDGNLWTRHFFDKFGISYIPVYDFEFTKKGGVWIAAVVLRRYFHDKWETIQLDGEAYSVVLDENDNPWVTTKEAGVLFYDGETWTQYLADGMAPGKMMRDGAIDSDGNLWFVGNDGISKYDGDTWVFFNEDNGLISNDVFSILIDKDGYFWFGTSKGVSRFDGNEEWIDYTIDNGLISNSRVNRIFQDKKGNIWFNSPADGVSKFDGTTWSYYTIDDGLPSNSVTSFAEDTNGNIWFGTTDGIAILHQEEAPYPEVNIYVDKTEYKQSDTIKVSIDGENKGDTKAADVWLVMLDPAQNLYFATLWNSNPAPTLQNITFPTGFMLPMTEILQFSVPNNLPPIGALDNYIFAVGLADPGTYNFFNISTAPFSIVE